jgi:hypothetical protein
MKLTDKFLLEGIIFIILFAMYMIWSDRPIVFKNFWRTYFYVLLYSMPMVLFLTLFPLNNLFKVCVNWTIIIFFFELIVYNILWVNKNDIEFSKYCSSTMFGIVFSLSLVVMLIISFIVKWCK